MLAWEMICCLMAPSHYLNNDKGIRVVFNRVQFHRKFSRYISLIVFISKIASLRLQLDLPEVNELTDWVQDKMAAIFQITFSDAFSGMKMYRFQLRFHWRLFPRVQITIFQYLFRKWLGADQATSHYLKQWWLVYWWIYASLDLNELSSCSIWIP